MKSLRLSTGSGLSRTSSSAKNHASKLNGQNAGVSAMSSPLCRVITNEIFRVPARRKRKPAVKPSDIPTLKGYTARLVDQKWLRLAARRNHA
ncbi:conserved protein of unknown function [Enterobacter cancerogenus]|nr:conserved protein of unknown function [Enterobacter cancerogenus]